MQDTDPNQNENWTLDLNQNEKWELDPKKKNWDPDLNKNEKRDLELDQIEECDPEPNQNKNKIEVGPGSYNNTCNNFWKK